MRSITKHLFTLTLATSGLLANAQTWTTVGTTPNPAYAGRWSPASFTIGTKVYFGGGYVNNSNAIDFWEFNTADKKWTQKKDIPGSDRTGGVFFSIGGKGYIGLGAKDFNSISLTPTPLKDLYEYDPAANTWTKKADLPDSARYESTVVVMNNKAYIIGGTTGKYTSASGYQVTNDVWEYNPTNNQWTAKKPYPAGPIRQAMAFSLLNKAYVACGELISGTTITESNATYEYNPTTDAWTKKADFPGTERASGVGFTVGTTGFAGLGKKGYTSFFQDIYTYNPTTNKWSTTSMLIPGAGRSFSSVAVHNNRAYIGAGWSLAGSSQKYYNDWYELAMPGVGISPTINSAQAITCYPNPCKGKLYIDIASATPNKSYTWNLYDLTGRKARSGTITNHNYINTQNLIAGKYILEIDVDGNPFRATIDAAEQ